MAGPVNYNDYIRAYQDRKERAEQLAKQFNQQPVKKYGIDRDERPKELVSIVVIFVAMAVVAAGALIWLAFLGVI